MIYFKRFMTIALLLSILASASADATQSAIKPSSKHKNVLLLDVAQAGDRLVAVGTMGLILYADKNLQNWYEANNQHQVLLTGVYFSDDKIGWAVGHDEIILKTEDGGKNWREVYKNADNERPLLDIWFKNRLEGIAVGAYGAFLRSSDGGETWREEQITAEVEDLHLNKISKGSQGNLYIAAEAGNVYLSQDYGLNFKKLTSPYGGSFFGVAEVGTDSVLFSGLQGNVYAYHQADKLWQKVNVGNNAILNSVELLASGDILVTGNDGTIVAVANNLLEYKKIDFESRSSIATSLELNDGRILLVGDFGLEFLAASLAVNR